MALYLVRQQDGKFAVFDDLLPGFCSFGMHFGECVTMVMEGRGCDAETSMFLVNRCRSGTAVSVRRPGGTSDVMTLDGLLTALRIIRGEPAMLTEAARIGLSGYRPCCLDDACRNEVEDICEAYGVEMLDYRVIQAVSRLDAGAARVSKAMLRAWERWSMLPGGVAAEDRSKPSPTHLSG